MASEEQKKLAEFIKNVHQMLRINARKIGASQAWKEHCQEEKILSQYAEAMRQLALEHWEHNADKKVYSRIQWIAEQSLKYFFNGGREMERNKEIKRNQYQENSGTEYKNFAECKDNISTGELILLDVGSCYNPFRKYPFFRVIPIDLKPASNDVFEADFLNLSVTSDKVTTEDITKMLPIRSFPENHFDIVVFSLLLEYMPSCQQRFVCCEKAYHILKPEGLLFIISPDSKHASANASLMRQWRICLAYLGFTRVVYEKLPHIHCMAFRKNCHVVASQQWARRAMSQKNGYFLMENMDNVHELLKIPQDDTEYLIAEVVEQPIRSDEDNSELVDMFEELPQDLELL
ncbi:hypothetical protein R5R35_007121 [Gryllus longicercus]|uniref:S-adenosylmethionine sensor upstream of mTORC1 n=1 Tax=Gryllus longicercus TaxID=2509291 RepID=A0AAN9Z836_9ORTH